MEKKLSKQQNEYSASDIFIVVVASAGVYLKYTSKNNNRCLCIHKPKFRHKIKISNIKTCTNEFSCSSSDKVRQTSTRERKSELIMCMLFYLFILFFVEK